MMRLNSASRSVSNALMELLHYAFFFLVAVGVLITFHEAGHFLVARIVGVHVVRFSVGFGKRVWSRRDRHGTEFVLAALPLGGYVRLYDRRDADAAEHAPADPALAHRSYDRLKPQWRIAILLGGPVANFVLAFLLFWLAAMAGVTVAPARIGVDADGPAYAVGMRNGEVIVAVDGEAITTWTDVSMALAGRLGDSGRIEIETTKDGYRKSYSIPIDRWHADTEDPDLLESLGLGSELPAFVDSVLAGEPAERGGLRPKDRITHVDGQPVSRWEEFVAHVQESAETPLRISVQREGVAHTFSVTPARKFDDGGNAYGFVGIRAGLPTHVLREGPLDALARAAEDTWDYTALTVKLIGKLIAWEVSPMNVAGPITIAKASSDSARAGFGEFLSLLALLSINLGIINLLPIPVLDGGQIALNAVELVRRKPAAAWVEAMTARVGIVLVGGLMVLVFYADFDRWLWPLAGN